MKSIIIIFIQLVFVNCIISQSYTDKRGNEQLWGSVLINQLQDGSYAEWYSKNYENFETSLSKKDGELLKDVEVKVFIGTWCGDTKYLLPKFIKSWEAMGLENSKLELIALHNSEDQYKQGPSNETKGLNIHRVPTFIFEKNGEEIGRIVERTVFDLDTDILAIAKGFPYEQRYRAVTILDTMMVNHNRDSLDTKTTLRKCVRAVYREASSVGELNTYGYVLIAEKKFEFAELVLKVNRYLNPFHPNARDSYGEILFRNGKLEEAKEEYLEAIRLKPDNDHAFSQLVKINKELEEIELAQLK